MATKERKFCVVNFQKAHRGDLKGLQFEANRSAEEVERNPFAFNVNVDAKRTDSNKFLRRSDDWDASITEIIDAAGVTEKSDSVVAVTGVVAFSEDWPGAGDPEKVDAYLEDALAWAENKLGLKVFNAVIHYDETSAHLQFAGVPIVEQPVYVREVRKDEDGLIITLHYDPIVTDDPHVQDLRNWIDEQVRAIDPRCSIHDLRTVPGPTHVNVIFDCMRPANLPLSADELRDRVAGIVKEKVPDAVCKITIDESYVSPEQ